MGKQAPALNDTPFAENNLCRSETHRMLKSMADTHEQMQ